MSILLDCALGVAKCSACWDKLAVTEFALGPRDKIFDDRDHARWVSFCASCLLDLQIVVAAEISRLKLEKV